MFKGRRDGLRGGGARALSSDRSLCFDAYVTGRHADRKAGKGPWDAPAIVGSLMSANMS